MKGAVLMSRASTQPRVAYVSGLLQDVVSGLAKDTLDVNQHEIGKLNTQLATMTDGDELTVLNIPKERKMNKGFAINRVLVHAAEYFTAYAEQARMFGRTLRISIGQTSLSTARTVRAIAGTTPHN